MTDQLDRIERVLRVSSQAPKAAAPQPQQQAPPKPAPPRPAVAKPVPPPPPPDDELVVSETPADKFLIAVAGLFDTDAETIKARLRAMGYTGIPADRRNPARST